MNIFISEQFINLLPIIGAFLVSFSLVVWILARQRLNFNNPVLIGFIGIISLSSWWSFTYFFRYISIDLFKFEILLYIEYIPHIFIGLVWLFFCLLFVEKKEYIKKYGIWLSLPPAISFILMLTNDFHNLFFSNISINNIEHGIFWYFPHLSLSYIYIFIGFIVLSIHFFKTKKKNRIKRKRVLMTIIGVFIPLVGNIIDSFLTKFGIIDIKIDLTPVFFTFSNIFFAIALLKYRLFSLSPVLFKELMKSITAGVMIFDYDNRLLKLNYMAEKLIGADEKKLKGRDIKYICQKVKCENEEIKKYILENKQIRNSTVKLIASSEMHVNFSVSFIKNRHGDIISKVVVLNDITQIKKHEQKIAKKNTELENKSLELKKKNEDLHKSEQALMNLTEDLQSSSKKLKISNKKLSEADEMRKEFVSHTAHELRTPLNSFRWSLEMLLNEDVGRINRSQRELLDQIYKSNIRLLGLVEDLLEVSRMDQSRIKIEIKKCELDKLIDRVLGDLSIKIREKNIKLVWEKDKKKLPNIKADPDRMIQVLINVIGNAVKYTESNGRISIKISEVDYMAPPEIIKEHKAQKCPCIKNIGQHKRYLLCKIADSGIGIPKKDQQKMFSRFFRASNAILSQEEGTGLGMTITKKIIELHQGMIWFESIEGEGTNFYFTIPIAHK